MEFWQCFATRKQQGEWVELQFMAQAARRRFAVSKPWGDIRSYDVGIDHGENFLRVQVKSTTYRSVAGYRCLFRPNVHKKVDYSPKQLDLFAAYVIPEDVWYFIPPILLLGERRRSMAMLCPVVPPKKKACYRYEAIWGASELETSFERQSIDRTWHRRHRPRLGHKSPDSPCIRLVKMRDYYKTPRSTMSSFPQLVKLFTLA